MGHAATRGTDERRVAVACPSTWRAHLSTLTNVLTTSAHSSQLYSSMAQSAWKSSPGVPAPDCVARKGAPSDSKRQLRAHWWTRISNALDRDSK